MDIFPGHVKFDDLFKQSDWLLRLPFVCFDYFRVSLLLSRKKKLTFFQVLFIFSHIQNLTNFDIDSYKPPKAQLKYHSKFLSILKNSYQCFVKQSDTSAYLTCGLKLKHRFIKIE